MERELIIKYSVLTIFLLITAYMDVRYKKIPNKLILLMLVGGLAVQLIGFDWQNFIMAVIGVAVAAVVLVGTYLFSKGSLGEGDVKLAICTALYIGVFDFISLMIYALILTVIAGVFVYIFKRKDNSKQLPFAPFMLIGCVMNVIFYINM